LLERKGWLQTVLKAAGLIRYADSVPTEGSNLCKLAEELEVEGIVAERTDSPQRRGRTGDWVKIKTGAGQAINEKRAKWNER
jgi:bifunctional non-homologous end joining protein LigD